MNWGDGAARGDGELSLRGVVHPVTLEARHSASRCGRRLAVQAEGQVDHAAFGIRCDVPGAGLFMPCRLRLAVRVEAEFDDVAASAA